MTDPAKASRRLHRQEPGLIWKIWTENAATNEAGGIYLFADRPSAGAYLTDAPRASGLRHPEVNGKIFDVNGELSAIDRAAPEPADSMARVAGPAK